ncbi:hypothetical protein FACS1894188_05990 [Clostridia bacterium]|nr:hypothetical protein FACS1894188_05990 [Clostridia bacterium]
MTLELLTREFVISVPKLADSNGIGGFFEALSKKLNDSTELARIIQSGWKFTTLIPYDTRADERKFEDRGNAQIQGLMIEREKEMVNALMLRSF